MNPLLDAALKYAGRRWHVFPIHWPINGKCSCSKVDCENQGKHPLTTNGFKDATTDPKIITEWWTKSPAANIGIATGAVSGIVVVDIDNPEAKEEVKKILPSDYDINLVTRSVTGRGWHLVFAHPQVEIKNRTGILPKVDVRGDGGYFIVWPSMHVSGKQYKWQVPPGDEFKKLPVELYRLLTSGSSNHNGSGEHGRFDSSVVWEGIPEGQRDDELFRYACQLRSFNAPRDVIEELIAAAAARCRPPFPTGQALAKVEQAWKYPAGHSDGAVSGTGYREQASSTESPREEKATNHHFTLVSAKEVLAAEDVETSWIWDGILPTGGMSLIVAKPKVGKTTLAFDLAVSVARGSEFLNRKTERGSVVYLALEEKKGEIKKKLKSAGITNEPLVFHFGSAPLDALKQVEPLIVETQAKLLIIDVLQKFCRLRDLNDYAQVTNTLEPLMSAARKQGCHILLTHHAGKADRPDGDDILGSTGLLGGVDTSVHIKKRDKRRILFTIQRYGEDLPETVIELRENGSLEAIGTRQDVEVDETLEPVIEVLKRNGSMTLTEIHEALEKGRNVVSKAVNLLIEKRLVEKSGSGKRNDPYKYSVLLYSDTNGYGNTETKSDDKPLESKEESRTGLFPQNEKDGNGISTAFFESKDGPKEASFSAEIYTAKDRLEEERYAKEERAGIEDEDGFEKVSR